MLINAGKQTARRSGSSWSALAPDELAAQREVEAKVLAEFGDGMDLLHDLSIHTNHELHRLSAKEIADAALRFRVLMIAQGINAAWNLTRAITSGYPRIALYLTRLLREGHIAVAWATTLPDEARRCWESGTQEDPRGPWPSAGDMAIAVKGQTSESAPAWGGLLSRLGKTHNELFAHAVSEFGLLAAALSEPEGLRLSVGPTFDADLTKITIDHSMILFAFLLNDAVLAVAAFNGAPESPEATAILGRAGEYIQRNPIPAV